MDGHELRKYLLSSKKTERIIFAATPQTKAALEAMAHEQCMSVSALITKLVVDEAMRNADIVTGEVLPHV